MLTKNLNEELENYGTWFLALSPEKDKGIAALQNEENGEQVYLFFSECLEFVKTYFPVLIDHPEYFDVNLQMEVLFVSPCCG